MMARIKRRSFNAAFASPRPSALFAVRPNRFGLDLFRAEFSLKRTFDVQSLDQHH